MDIKITGANNDNWKTWVGKKAAPYFYAIPSAIKTATFASGSFALRAIGKASSLVVYPWKVICRPSNELSLLALKFFSAIDQSAEGRIDQLQAACQEYSKWDLLENELFEYKLALKDRFASKLLQEDCIDNPRELQEALFKEYFLNKETTHITEALRLFFGLGIADDKLLYRFFSEPLMKNLSASLQTKNQILSVVNRSFYEHEKGIKEKRKNTLKNSFQPMADEVCQELGYSTNVLWSNFSGLLTRIDLNEEFLNRDNKFNSHDLAVFLLKSFRQLMVAPQQHDELIKQLSHELFKGQKYRDNIILPSNEPAKKQRSTDTWQEMLFQQAGVDDGAKFLDGVLTVISDEITRVIRSKLKNLNENSDKFDIIQSIIRHPFQSFWHPKQKIWNPILNEVASKTTRKVTSTDDDGVSAMFSYVSKHVQTQLLKALINISHVCIDDVVENPAGHENGSLLGQLLLNLSHLWDKHKDEISPKLADWHKMPEGDEKQKFFIALFTPLTHSLLDFANVDFLKDFPFLSAEWKANMLQYLRNELLPDSIGKIFLGLTQWEQSREANEQKLTDFSPYAVGSSKYFSRLATETIQGHVAQNGKSVADNARNTLISYFKDRKTTAGDQVADELVKRADYISSIANDNLIPLVGDNELWNDVENAIHPITVKLLSNFFDQVSERDGSIFMHQMALKAFRLINSHVEKINTTVEKVNKNQNTIYKQDATEIDKLTMFEGVAGQSGAGVLSNTDYVAAKKAVLIAQSNLQAAKGNLSYLERAKKVFHVGDTSGESRQAYRTAKIALKKAIENLEKIRRDKICVPLTEKLLNIVKLNDAKDLPLPSEFEAIREPLWKLLKEVMVPMLLNNIHHLISDPNTLNKLVRKSMKTMVENLKSPQEDPHEKAIRLHLELVASAEKEKMKRNPMPQAAAMAKKALAEIKEGATVTKAIKNLLADHPSKEEILYFKDAMVNPPIKPTLFSRDAYEWSPETRQEWEEIVDSKEIKRYRIEREDIRQFVKTNNLDKLSSSQKMAHFNEDVGELIRGFVNMLPTMIKNLPYFQNMVDSSKDSVGKSVRSMLEKWNLKNIVINGLKNAPGKEYEWITETDAFSLKKISKSKGSEFSRDFGMPLTSKAKKEWDAKKNLGRLNDAHKQKQTVITAMGLQSKALFTNWIKSLWLAIVERIINVIYALFGDNAESIRNSIEHLLKYLLETFVVRLSSFVFDPIATLLSKGFEVLVASGAVDHINDGIHMEINEELYWDLLDMAFTQLSNPAVLKDEV